MLSKEAKFKINLIITNLSGNLANKLLIGLKPINNNKNKPIDSNNPSALPIVAIDMII